MREQPASRSLFQFLYDQQPAQELVVAEFGSDGAACQVPLGRLDQTGKPEVTLAQPSRGIREMVAESPGSRT